MRKRAKYTIRARNTEVTVKDLKNCPNIWSFVHIVVGLIWAPAWKPGSDQIMDHRQEPFTQARKHLCRLPI